MSKSALLKTLIAIIRARVGKNEGSFLSDLSRDLTKVDNCTVGKIIDLIKETLSDFKYGTAQLIHFLTRDVMNYTRIGYFLDMTVIRQLCVQNASPLFTHSLTTHSIFTTI